jgi:hypothetical protein
MVSRVHPLTFLSAVRNRELYAVKWLLERLRHFKDDVLVIVLFDPR